MLEDRFCDGGREPGLLRPDLRRKDPGGGDTHDQGQVLLPGGVGEVKL